MTQIEANDTNSVKLNRIEILLHFDKIWHKLQASGFSSVFFVLIFT